MFTFSAYDSVELCVILAILNFSVLQGVLVRPPAEEDATQHQPSMNYNVASTTLTSVLIKIGKNKLQ